MPPERRDLPDDPSTFALSALRIPSLAVFSLATRTGLRFSSRRRDDPRIAVHPGHAAAAGGASRGRRGTQGWASEATA